MKTRSLFFITLCFFIQAQSSDDHSKSSPRRIGLMQVVAFGGRNVFEFDHGRAERAATQERYERATASEKNAFMGALRSLSSTEKERIISLLDECEFAPTVDYALRVHNQIDDVWKQHRIRRYGSFREIFFVANGERTAESAENLPFVQRELDLGLETNVYGESQDPLSRRAHRQGFEDFLNGLRRLNSVDRDSILRLYDDASFDARSATETLEKYDRINLLLKKIKFVDVLVCKQCITFCKN